MVTATLAPPNIPDSNASTPKRTLNSPAPFPAAKKRRSYEDRNTNGGGSSINTTLRRGHPEQLVSIVSSPAHTSRDEASDVSMSSPGPLKSSFKSATSNTITTSSMPGSPSEGDKKGMYSDYVVNALDDRARGKESSYLELVSQFRSPSPKSLSSAPPIGLLQMLLHSLSNVASRLDRRNHAALVDGILTLPWATMGGDAFARIWMRFVCTLCSARSEWVGEVLSRAVKGLSYRSDWRSLAFVTSGTSNSRPTRRIIYSRIHSLLRSLLSLIPTLPTQLAPLVLKHFPHKREGVKEHVVYVRNIFEMCEYADELRTGVLECVLGRGVEFDVEIQIELDELEEAEADLEEMTTSSDVDTKEQDSQKGEVQDDLDVFDKPIDEDSSSDDDDNDNDNDTDSEEGLEDIGSDDEADEKTNARSQSDRERTKQIRLLVDKLDVIMQTMFQQLEAADTRYLRICKGLDRLDHGMTPARAITLRNDQFSELMHIFTKTLLPTFKCRHVQFLLFWFSSLDQDFSDLFLGLLLSKAIYGNARKDEERSEETPMIMRVAAASYVASLVSRAKYINKRDARTVMLNLCAFLEAHLDAYGNGWLGSDEYVQKMDDSTVVGPNSLFYAVCQACLYIFCFRWRDLQVSTCEGDAEEGSEDDLDASEIEEVGFPSSMASTSKWCEGLDVIKRAITSNLNPLANCSSAVAEQFAGVAQYTGFMYCWSLIEKNNRNIAPTSSSKGSSGVKASLPRSESTDTILTTIESTVKKQQQQQQQQQQQGSLDDRSASASSRKELDSFFPFDPYRLRASTKWVEPLYREWSDVAPDGMLDDDEDDEEEEAEDENVDDDDDGESSSDSVVQLKSNRNALKIPKAKKSSKYSRFGSSSASTNDDPIARSLNSLEAMSISPFRGR
ncbi:hypothetical protein CBS101457_000901 [Exobasidium rhododendri]|nr:hypothetical protein CBS101457_000901 [Exobasidium rhododendri]